MIFNALTFLGGAVLLFLTFRLYRFLKSLKFLRDVEYAGGRRWPTVSLVIPACNEAETIGPALESLLKLNYPNYEIIAVNDRSIDTTGEIISSLASEDSRLKPVHVTELPVGWLGKVHALHLGSQAAKSEWVLFSDADVHFSPDALKKAVAYCEERELDILAVGPELIADSVLLKSFLCHLIHQASLAVNKARLESAEYADAIGIGAFNLVRREWLEKIGGFESIRLDVIDDGALAYMVKKAGGKNSFLSGIGEIKIEWYKDFMSLVRGLEKNAFAMLSYSLPAVLALALFTWSGFFICFVAPFFVSSPDVRSFYLMSLILYFIFSGVGLRKGAMPAWYAVTLPFTLLLAPLIPLRSAIICLRNGGITWRGTLYPLFLVKREQKFKVLNMILGRG